MCGWLPAPALLVEQMRGFGLRRRLTVSRRGREAGPTAASSVAHVHVVASKGLAECVSVKKQPRGSCWGRPLAMVLLVSHGANFAATMDPLAGPI